MRNKSIIILVAFIMGVITTANSEAQTPNFRWPLFPYQDDNHLKNETTYTYSTTNGSSVTVTATGARPGGQPWRKLGWTISQIGLFGAYRDPGRKHKG